MTLLLLVSIFLAAVPDHLHAQSVPPSRPPAELSLNWAILGGLVDVSAKGDPQLGVMGPALGVRVNIRERVGLEVGGMLGSVEDRSVGFYDAAVVIRRSVPRVGQWSSTLRFGGGGSYESFTVNEYRRTNDDRSVTVFPGYRWRKLTWPNMAIAGMGMQRTFSTRTALAVEGALVAGEIGVGLRVSTGLVVPVGGTFGPR